MTHQELREVHLERMQRLLDRLIEIRDNPDQLKFSMEPRSRYPSLEGQMESIFPELEIINFWYEYRQEIILMFQPREEEMEAIKESGRNNLRDSHAAVIDGGRFFGYRACRYFLGLTYSVDADAIFDRTTYGKPVDQITVEDVIDRLTKAREFYAMMARING